MSDNEFSEELEIIENNEAIEEYGNTEQEPAENNENATNANQTEVKVKRVVKPQAKLNSERLKGPKGIQTLEGLFKKIKFKGHGHEEEDLKTLLWGYEYWCYRLFPKFKFEDSIKKIELLGSKKDVLTHIKKIRMDLLYEENIDAIPNDESDEEPESFNSLTRTQPQELLQSDSPIKNLELSEEQLERIRINREQALKRRLELMQQKNSQQSQEYASSSGLFGNPMPAESLEIQSLNNHSQDPDNFNTEIPSQSSPVRILEAQPLNETEKEQLEHIRINPEQALNRRHELMQQKNSQQSQEYASSSGLFGSPMPAVSLEIQSSMNHSQDPDNFNTDTPSQSLPVRILEAQPLNETENLTSPQDFDSSIPKSPVGSQNNDGENMDID